MSIGCTENTARLETNGRETRLLINFDVSGLNSDEKKSMLHGCLRQLCLLEQDCLGKKFKEPNLAGNSIVRIAG